MISIKKYLLKAQEPAVPPALLRMCQLLLEGIGIHAVEGDEEDYRRFQTDLRQLEQSMSHTPSHDDLFLAAGAAIKAMEDYNRSTTRFVRIRSNELQKMVGMLSQTIVSVATCGERSLSRLQDIEKQIERAAAVEDIQALKLKLSACLESVREEVVEQRKESNAFVEGLTKELVQVKERTQPRLSMEIDRLTGFPTRPKAEEEIAAACGEGNSSFLAVFAVNRLGPVNARFGFAVGDQIIQVFADHLKKQFPAGDFVCRWSGGAFVAVIQRDGPLSAVRAEVARISASPLDTNVHLRGRIVPLPVTARSIVFSLGDIEATEAERRVEQFAGLHEASKGPV
ncbi:MAG: diguanylate cyclase domain-containing protein [Bryobacteraceae bacterium]